LHVRAFQAAARDGIGDFRGLHQRLDYLQDLAHRHLAAAVHPSPLKDDGYDIADYTRVHPSYERCATSANSLTPPIAAVCASHRLVVNHTSDQHPWFKRARLAPPGSPERDFYVWTDNPSKYKDARIIFKDSSDRTGPGPVANAYYWHLLYSHQPDLNFDNRAVWDALTPILDFWLNMGVDGMRLDAIRTCSSAREQLREPPRDARLPQVPA